MELLKLKPCFNNLMNQIHQNLNNKNFYFIHKFCCKPKNNDAILAKSKFNGIEFCSAIKHRNIEGYQFHPEKSGKNGLSIYKNLKKKLNENTL